MKNVFKLSLNNFAAYRKIYIKIICALIALLFLITLVCSFTLSVNAKQNDMLREYISANYVIDERILSRDEVGQSFQTIELQRVTNILEHIFGDDDPHSLNSTDFAVDYQNERFYSDEYAFIEAYVATNGVFTENDYKEAGENADLFLGRYPQTADEIVLSENILKCYGLTRDVLGKRIKLTTVKRIIKVNEQTSPTLSDDNVAIVPIFGYEYVDLPFKTEVTVCGIITNDYYRLCGHSLGWFWPTMLVSPDNAFAQMETKTEYLCSFDEWASKDTVKYLEDNDFEYVGDSYLKRIEAASNLQLVVNQLVLYFGSALIVGIVFTLMLLCEKLCSAQMKNSGMLLMSGLTNGRLFYVWLVQFAIAAAIALVLASGMSFGVMYGISELILRTFRWSLTVSAATFFVIAGIGFVAVAAVTVTTLLYFALRFRRKQTRELLDT